MHLPSFHMGNNDKMELLVLYEFYDYSRNGKHDLKTVVHTATLFIFMKKLGKEEDGFIFFRYLCTKIADYGRERENHTTAERIARA